MGTMNNVVVGIDFRDGSREAVSFARQLVRSSGGRLHLLHVLPDVLRNPWMDEAGVDFARLQRKWQTEAEERLITFAASLGLDPLTTATAVVTGPVDAALVRHAQERAADALVLGSQDHGLIRRFLLGSVTDRVLRHVPCPVIVAPCRPLRGAPPTPVVP